MERTRNWQGWLALILAGAALVVALGGRFWPDVAMGSVAAIPAAPAAPAAPAEPAAPAWGEGRFERGRGGPPAFMRERLEREMERADRHATGPAWAAGRGESGHHFGPGLGHRFGPIGFFFGLLRGLGQLIALGLLAWLLLRMFNQRNSQPAAPAAPTTPAGHDPRVE
jgi:hypothetical protein